MIRTFIVDQESSIRKYIADSISTLNTDFDIIGVAANGKMAWEIIQIQKPDVVFLDVQLPLMDGLEVLKLCNTLKNPPFCVFVSELSEFTYTREAIKHNAFDYILKPINQEQLSEILNTISEHMFGKKQLVQQEFFSNLLHHHPISFTDREIDYAFEPNIFYYTFYVCIGSYSIHYYNQFDVLGNYLTEINFDKHIRSFISSDETIWILQSETKNEFYLIYGLMKKDNKRHKIFLSKLMNFTNAFSFPVTLIYGASTNKKENLKDFFIDYRHILKNITIFAEPLIHDINDKIKHYNINVLNFSEQKLFADLVAEQKYDLFHQQLDVYLKKCEDMKCSNRKLNGFLKRICEIANNNCLAISFTEQVDELLTNTFRYSDVRDGIHDIINDIFHTFPENSTSNVVIQIKEFIDNNYTEQISLSYLAEKFNISMSYLSTLFKKNYHISPNEYIIKLRMARAKILLSSNDEISIRQISELIGYSDPYYFSRLFKMSVGVTPSSYHSMSKDIKPAEGS